MSEQREALAAGLSQTRDPREHSPNCMDEEPCWYCYRLADALLASPQFASLIADAEARALREAATDWDALLPDAEAPGVFARWLLARAALGGEIA